jgi:hypothetical protein
VVTLKDRKSIHQSLVRLGVDVAMRRGRMRWFGHVDWKPSGIGCQVEDEIEEWMRGKRGTSVLKTT